MVRKNGFGPLAGSYGPAVGGGKLYYHSTPDYNETDNWVDLERRLNCINYAVQRYYSNNMDRHLVAIEPKGWWETGAVSDGEARHWGMFIFNGEPRNYAVIEIPHPKFDLYSELMGAEAFEKGDAFALFIAGGHRYAIDNPETTGDTWDDVGELRGKADVAHIAKTIHGRTMSSTNIQPAFQWAHEGLFFAAPDGRVLPNRVALGIMQFHGFNEDGGTGTVGDYYKGRGEHVVAPKA